MDKYDILKFTYYNNLYNVYDLTRYNINKYGLISACSMIGTNTPQTVPKKINIYELYQENPSLFNINCGLNPTDELQLELNEETTYPEHKSKVNTTINKIFNNKNYAICCMVMEEKNNEEEDQTIYDYLSYGITNNDLIWNEGYSYESYHAEGIILNTEYYPAARQLYQEQETVWIANGNYFCEIDSPFQNNGPKTYEQIYSRYIENYNLQGFYGTWYIVGIKSTNKFYFGNLDADLNWNQGLQPFSPSFNTSESKICFGVSWFNTKTDVYNLEINLKFYTIDWQNTNVTNWLKNIYIN